MLRALLAILCLGACADPAPERPPDVLLVTIDTARADRFSYQGPSPVPTPVVDALAARGAAFSAAVAPAPITLVSHASILTGLEPPAHGVRNNGTYRLSDEPLTLAELFGRAGWRTAAFVGATVLASRYGLARGFDHYDDAVDTERSDGLFAIGRRDAGAVVAAALDWLGEQPTSTPTLVWVHLYDPHAPYQPPEPERTLYASAPYDGEIAGVDRALGELLEGYEQSGRARGAIVALTADHGESLGEHGEMTHSLFVYDAALRVPLVLTGPGIKPGTRVDRQVRLVDLFRTLAGLAGLAVPEGPGGTDLGPLLRGEPPPEPAPAWIESLYPRENYGWKELVGIRTEDWKLVLGVEPELYDLRTDPGELADVAAAHPDVVEEQRARLEAMYPGATEAEGSSLALDAETRDALAQLGYLWTAAEATEEGPAPDPRAMVGVLVLMEEAVALAQAGRTDEAIAANRAVLARDPRNATAADRLALLLRQAGRTDEALEAFAFAASLLPGQPFAQAQLGRALMDAGRAPDAVALLDDAAARGVESIELVLTRAEARLAGGDPTGAEADLARVQALLPEAWRTGLPGASAVPDRERAWDAQAAGRIGDAAWQAEDWGLAAEAFGLAALFAPGDARPYYNQGLALGRLGEFGRARAAHAAAIERDPSFEGARRHLAALDAAR